MVGSPALDAGAGAGGGTSLGVRARRGRAPRREERGSVRERASRSCGGAPCGQPALGLQRRLNPLRELRQHLGDACALRVQLVGQRLHVFAEALLESIQSVDFVLGPTARLIDDLARTVLRGGGELSRLALRLRLAPRR